jgi:protein-disulfide isomerase
MNAFSRLFGRTSAEQPLPHLHDNAPNFTAPIQKLPSRALQLDIVVGGRCPICQASMPTLEALRHEIPNVNVRVIDMDAPGASKPKNIIAIPTFLLNGYIVATGNPNLDELKEFIRSLNS